VNTQVARHRRPVVIVLVLAGLAGLEALLARNATTVQPIRAVDDGSGSVDIRAGKECPSGGSSILITYANHAQRTRIEGIVRGTELEAAPINWRNA
jgi:hypothetical protein